MPWACSSEKPCKCCYYTIGTKAEDGTMSTGWHMNAVGEWHWWHGDAPHCSARALEEMTWTRRLIRIFKGPVEPACPCCYYSYAQGWPPKCGWFVGEWSDHHESYTWTWSHYDAPHYRWPWRVPRSHIVGTWAEYLFPPGGPDPTEAEYKEICERGWRDQWPLEYDYDDDSEGSGSGMDEIMYRVDLQVHLPRGPEGPGGPGSPIGSEGPRRVQLPGGPGGPGGPEGTAQEWMMDYLNQIVPAVDMSAAAWIAARNEYRENAVQQGDEALQRTYRNLEENPDWIAMHANPGPAGPDRRPNPQGPEERFEDMIIVGLQLDTVPEGGNENAMALEYR